MGDRKLHRLHPSSLLFAFLGHAKGLLLPAIVVLLFASGERWQLYLALFIVPAMIFDVYRYISLRYRLDAEELVVTEGMFFKNERHIPFQRIQNIDLVEGVLARLLKVAEVRVETASGSEPEAVFKVLSRQDVERLRASLVASRDAGDASPPEVELPPVDEEASMAGHRLVALTPGDIMRLGFDPGRGMAIVAVAWGLLWEFDVFDRFDAYDRMRSVYEDLPSTFAVAVGVTATVLGFAALVMLLSLVWAVQRFHGYELRREEDQFRIRCGLFTRLAASIPRSRVQRVKVKQSPFLRAMGRATIQVRTAGGGGATEQAALSRQWFVPIARFEEVPALLGEIDRDFDFDAIAWRPLAPKAGHRMRKRALLGALIATVVVGLLIRPWGFASAILWIPLSLWGAAREARFTRWARTPFGMAHRGGAFYRTWELVRASRVQVVAARESPFDRRYAMATLVLDTAGNGPGEESFEVEFLERDRVEGLRGELATSAERAGFQWT